MLDKRITCIYTKCMYNCLYHVSSVGKAFTSHSDTAFPTDST